MTVLFGEEPLPHPHHANGPSGKSSTYSASATRGRSWTSPRSSTPSTSGGCRVWDFHLRTADAIAIDLWPSRGNHVHGF